MSNGDCGYGIRLESSRVQGVAVESSLSASCNLDLLPFLRQAAARTLRSKIIYYCEVLMDKHLCCLMYTFCWK